MEGLYSYLRTQEKLSWGAALANVESAELSGWDMAVRTRGPRINPCPIIG